jgi:hypothetical protein
MSYKFSTEVDLSLRRAGWYEGRKLEESLIMEKCVPVIKHQKCHFFKEAFLIFQEFGGLSLTDGEDEDCAYVGESALIIWPSTSHYLPEHWFSLEWMFGEALFPIATAGNGVMEIFVGSSGKIYASAHGFYFCGSRFLDCLENILGIGDGIKRMNDSSLMNEFNAGKNIFSYI